MPPLCTRAGTTRSGRGGFGTLLRGDDARVTVPYRQKSGKDFCLGSELSTQTNVWIFTCVLCMRTRLPQKENRKRGDLMCYITRNIRLILNGNYTRFSHPSLFQWYLPFEHNKRGVRYLKKKKGKSSRFLTWT